MDGELERSKEKAEVALCLTLSFHFNVMSGKYQTNRLWSMG